MSRAVQFVTHELIDGQAVLFTFCLYLDLYRVKFIIKNTHIVLNIV